MTVIVQVRKDGKRTRGENLDDRRFRIEQQAQEGKSQTEIWDAARALFVKPAADDTRAPHRDI